MLMLKSSLSKLSKSFNTNDQYKEIFPILFLKDITLDEHNEYLTQFPNNVVSLKDETMKDCEKDCTTLYNVLIHFNH